MRIRAGSLVSCAMQTSSTWPIVHPIMKARVALKGRIVPVLPTRVLRYAVETVLAYPVSMSRPPLDTHDDEPLAPKPVNTILWLEKNDALTGIEIAPINAEVLIDKVIYVFLYEWSNCLRFYHREAAFKGGIEHLDSISAHYRDVLSDTFANTRLLQVSFPLNRRGISLFEFVERALEECLVDG
ncbi:MAG: hypothetical protein MAG794_01260 [Gammaproteobacteria bacterium]|nr:hypothetical protein [Gammaproteobacteria bacterium]